MHATVPAVCGCHHQPSQRDQRAKVTQHAFDWRCSQAAERCLAQQTTSLFVCCCFLLPDACCLAAYRHSAYYLLSTAYCVLPSAYCPLPTAYCRLPTAYCLLPTACCMLAAAYCLLPTACLLPSAIRPQAQTLCPLPSRPCCCLLPSAFCPLQATICYQASSVYSRVSYPVACCLPIKTFSVYVLLLLDVASAICRQFDPFGITCCQFHCMYS